MEIWNKIKEILADDRSRLIWFIRIVLLIFVVSWLFGRGNTIIHWIKAGREINRQEAQIQRVPDDGNRLRRREETLKMLQTNPSTAPDTLTEAEILEGDLSADHRHILEHYIIDDYGYEQKVHLPILGNRFFQRFHDIPPAVC